LEKIGKRPYKDVKGKLPEADLWLITISGLPAFGHFSVSEIGDLSPIACDE
jgi:hypothetical protein